MTLSILGHLDRSGCTVIKWDDAKPTRAVLVRRGGLRRARMIHLRLGWTLTKVERWTGQGKGLACYLHFERAQ